MARRKAVNRTGISGYPGASERDVWVAFSCVKCGEMNYVNVGSKTLTLNEAMQEEWACTKCNYVHSAYTDLPSEWEHWDEELLNAESTSAQRFWKGFFTIATENLDSYWKQCRTCGRILPVRAFSKHKGFGVLEKQMECRSCKNAINAVGNPKRTSEQLREGAARRRLGDLLAALDHDAEQKLDVEDLFRRFEGRCFKTGVELDINQRETWHIDHILPSKYFYPLTKENAALLSKEANSNKRDRWPSEVYSPQELVRLSEITGANLELLSSPKPILNQEIDVNAAVDKWLEVRNCTDLNKRIRQLVKILVSNNLTEYLSEKNKKRLGIM